MASHWNAGDSFVVVAMLHKLYGLLFTEVQLQCYLQSLSYQLLKANLIPRTICAKLLLRRHEIGWVRYQKQACLGIDNHG